MNAPHVLPLLLAALAWQSALADPLYKSVDSAGHVTYSSTPPPGAKAEKVEMLPPPTEAETRQAEEQVKKAEERVSELEDKRREKEAAQLAQEAEEARLREAQKPPVPIVVEQPVYAPQPIYYPPLPGGGKPQLPPIRPIPLPAPLSR